MSKASLAVKLHDDGFSCSQAVFSVFAEELGLSTEITHKIASAFGGGMAGSGETCGAVSGALMVLGLKFGRTQPDDLASKEKTNELSNIFFEKFKAKHHSLLCRDLRLEDRSTAVQKKLAHETCSEFIKDAVLILEDIIAKNPNKENS
ncbi:MAG: C-GCAxxG-C-C family protein [Candidatus Cloacimonetes bacterium]|nr:C-GCAxxG-C-C family protein [Candidatus Cloacimonadota bacterium]MCF7812907.1 C-GCAxxG-C-C family protein [Candidatus Cloacimonadota bacterium]MCF7867119.1 C-GCAxxG-C-C family protein [Candidatus Cloacimonadota bacterium]MCF7882561.1 C-GCAxxG-C-C family protein [Candidatus Cloacimonadota bacterium]